MGRAEALQPQTEGQEPRRSDAGASHYRRREPEKSLLHQTVRGHLKTFLAEAEQDGGGLPRFVVAEFERYLRCGILANGFARVRCIACGDELLVAFSCKSRGICPSCTTRRMQGTATHLVDRVLPCVPMRQWVLSLPRWARFLLARDPRLITRTLDRALRCIFRRLATLVPPPRAHLVRYHGVFGPASKWRKEIVPAPAQSTCSEEAPCSSSASGASRPRPATDPPRPLDSRIPWSELLLRVFREDILACPCGGRRKVIAFIDERPAIERILGHLGLPTTGPPMAPARFPALAEDSLWQDDVPELQQALL